MLSDKKIPNRLANEKSPYLLQHAYNPVDWRPWGEEAFAKAKEEDKPVFMSIGYSTCHWCHVMERESFEDEEVAALLNDDFICIKVDREERPDIDSVYMSVCQSLTGQGGWPLTIIMTPDKKPFYAATYLPKRSRYGMAGLIDLLPKTAQLWNDSRTELTDTGETIVRYLRQSADKSAPDTPSEALPRRAFELLWQSFDKRYGGFGRAPKFPTPHNLLFLMRYSCDEKLPDALEMAQSSLINMYRGGIFDHIGGGFSRYSTDHKWLVPHFEKMLYDNALLTMAYLEAYLYTENPLYATVAKKTLGYVLAELTDESGGFYCGQDADSDGVEGRYYMFSKKEILETLGGENGRLFCERFGITEKGNFEGQNIPNLIDSTDYEEESPLILQCRERLYDYRLARARLHKDDKCLTSWNALMITALARASVILKDEAYLAAAEKAERFIAEKLTKNDRLLVRYRDGQSAGEGKLDDYAFYVWALLELYNATFETDYFIRAERFAQVMCEQFFDYTGGGFYLYGKDAEQLVTRPKDVYDGAIPSGNSVAAYALTRLAKLTGKTKWRDISDKQLQYLAGKITDYPAGYCFSLLAMMNDLYPSHELIALSPSQQDIQRLRRLAMEKSNFTVIVKTKDDQDKLTATAPFTRQYPVDAGKTRFYLCSGNTCSAPADRLDELNL